MAAGSIGFEGQIGLLTRGDRHHHRFTDSARDPEHESRRDARNCGRQHDLDRGLEFGCADGKRTVAQTIRHGAQGVFAERGDIGMIMMPMTMPALKMLKPGKIWQDRRLQQRRDKQEREEAETRPSARRSAIPRLALRSREMSGTQIRSDRSRRSGRAGRQRRGRRRCSTAFRSTGAECRSVAREQRRPHRIGQEGRKRHVREERPGTR